jgi:hypothetical protein
VLASFAALAGASVFHATWLSWFKSGLKAIKMESDCFLKDELYTEAVILRRLVNGTYKTFFFELSIKRLFVYGSF